MLMGYNSFGLPNIANSFKVEFYVGTKLPSIKKALQSC